MSTYNAQMQEHKSSQPLIVGGLIQRKCACGNYTVAGAECKTCSQKEETKPLQRAAIHNPALSSSEVQSLSAHPVHEAKQNSITSSFEHDFSSVRLTPQTKLKLSQPGDKYEREADRVAEQVTRSMIDPSGRFRLDSINSDASSQTMLQRQEEIPETSPNLETSEELDDEFVEDEESVDIEELAEDEPIADESGMPKRQDASAATPPTASLTIPKGGGTSLDGKTKSAMEQSFGYDFSQVRIHADGQAVESARQIQAQAYTIGSDIYFNEGFYNPASLAGTKLLAHELTHVVQQTGSAGGFAGQIQRKPNKKKSATKKTKKGGKSSKKESACKGACAPSKSTVHDGCNAGGAATGKDFIKDLTVQRKAHKLTATWSTGAKTVWECSPSTSSGKGGKEPTPLVKDDLVGIKCDKCHTNRKGAGMGYFTGFKSEGRKIGFHNSQLVGASHESHGCVRVSCSVAKSIQDNSSTGVTTINVVA
jgi:hypothetical protein